MTQLDVDLTCFCIVFSYKSDRYRNIRTVIRQNDHVVRHFDV